jgi:CHAD domain-containing protein
MKQAPLSLRHYATEQISARLGRVAFEVRRARKKSDDDTVHDLRVSIRRFTQALRVFDDLLPDGEGRRVRKQLRPVMKLAGEVRNLDIARELVRESKTAQNAALLDQLSAERRSSRQHLMEALRDLLSRDFSGRWRERLQLNA